MTTLLTNMKSRGEGLKCPQASEYLQQQPEYEFSPS